MFKIISFNANGIRSAGKKGFFDWLNDQNPDAVCIQETKAQKNQLTDPVYFPLAHNFYHDAVKKGYSGVALYLKQQPLRIKNGCDCPKIAELINQEGRFLEAQYKDFSLISLYMPSGTSGEIRQSIKEQLMGHLLPYLIERYQNGEKIIICGDINIAHTEKDIRNWKSNRNKTGFLPHERQWLSDLFNSGYCDGFRLLNQKDHQYSWWSQRSNARANNVGWRIDYQIISDSLKNKLISVEICPEPVFSDHAPLVFVYDLTA